MNAAARTRAWGKAHPRFGVLLALELVIVLFLLVSSFRPLVQISVPVDAAAQSGEPVQVPVAGQVPACGYRRTVKAPPPKRWEPCNLLRSATRRRCAVTQSP